MDGMVDNRTRLLQEQSTRLVTKNYVEPTDDIRAERQRATFEVQELAAALNGGKEKLQRRKELADMLAKTEWGDKTHRYSLSREEEYVAGLKGALGIWEMMRKEGLSLEDAVTMRSLLDLPGGLELHIGMFIPTILGQGDPEQQAKWLPMCYRLQIIGTYAQTELGHGTFVRGLETTATFDKERDEFIIHCPTLTSIKWWPGGLGKTSTHAVVMARTIVDGQDHGPHAFIVQLRSLEDHRPLLGVTVGDIGHKFGFGGVDNGFLKLEYVRIPRDHMLMRFAKVTGDGKYIPPPPANSKASYATMLFVRSDIVKNASWYLAKAVTIAVRYTSVRRQTAPKAGEMETQVLDYQNVANTLLPLLASAYSLHFMGASLFSMYKQFEANRDKGDFSTLPELHILSSGLKALCTGVTADGIEECRRTCGGHGYMKASGFPTLFASYVQNVTWEGDNNVLYLQVARFLLKSLGAAMQGSKLRGSAAYLSNLQQELSARSPSRSAACWLQRDVQLAAMRHRSARLCVQAAEVLKTAGGGKLAFEGKAWNSCTVEMVRLARAHCSCYLLENFWDSIAQLQSAGLSHSAVEVLQQLACLHALSGLEREGVADLLEDGYLAGEQAAALRTQHRALLAALRPNAVPLVDGFALEDYTLNSALGRYDGDVYRALLDSAQLSRLNATQEGPAWKGILEPVMRPSSRL